LGKLVTDLTWVEVVPDVQFTRGTEGGRAFFSQQQVSRETQVNADGLP